MSTSIPTSLLRAWRRLIFRLRRAQLDRDLAEEIEFHRALKHEAIGELSRVQMGNITLAAEDCRDMWSFLSLERLSQDVKYAARMLRRTPAFTAIAVLSLALGIGGNAAMFTLVNTLLVRPLPYRQPDRLVRITGVFPRAGVAAFERQSSAMQIAAVSPGSELNLTGDGPALRIVASYTSANAFDVLGASVARGRSFEAGEDAPGRDGVVILSNSLWHTQFHAVPAVIGRVIALNGVPHRIVGVMPPAFSYPSAQVQAWVPMRLDPSNFLQFWAGEFVPLLGRLRPGVTLSQAQREVPPLLDAFRKTFPYPMSRDWNRDSTVIPLQRDLTGDIRGKLVILLGSVGLVLLIACANVASLLLSRATTRRKEIALRIALGAMRSRILRQLLTESVLLAALGGVLGILFGSAALSIFKSLLPVSTPGLAQAAIDWPVAAAVSALALFTGLAFGIAPALSASQIDLSQSIRTGSQRSTAAFWTRLRGGLIGAEVALTVILVAGAGLLIKSLYTLSEVHPGFAAQQILTVRLSPNASYCASRPACIALFNRLLQGARDIPGVSGAAIASSIPLDAEQTDLAVDVEDHPKSVDHPAPMFWSGAVTAGYLQILRIPVLAGRDFTAADAAQSSPVVLMSASTARRFWPTGNPIGKHVKATGEQQWRTVVGIVGDVRQYSLAKPLPDFIQGAIYVPYAQAARADGQIPSAMTLLVKTQAAVEGPSREIRALAQNLDPNVPIGAVQPLEEVVAGSIANFRATIRVFISFAAAAILLAAIGIYGLVSYWVSQRTYEIGLRVAIGATRRRIVSMILAQGLRVALYGLFAGVIVSLAVTRLLASLLYGVGATDPVTFASVTALVLVVAIAATAIPAWRASRIDPIKSLRVD